MVYIFVLEVYGHRLRITCNCFECFHRYLYDLGMSRFDFIKEERVGRSVQQKVFSSVHRHYDIVNVKFAARVFEFKREVEIAAGRD